MRDTYDCYLSIHTKKRDPTSELIRDEIFLIVSWGGVCISKEANRLSMGQCGSSNIAKNEAPTPTPEVESKADFIKNLDKKASKLEKHVDGHPCIVQVSCNIKSHLLFYFLLFAIFFFR